MQIHFIENMHRNLRRQVFNYVFYDSAMTIHKAKFYEHYVISHSVEFSDFFGRKVYTMQLRNSYCIFKDTLGSKLFENSCFENLTITFLRYKIRRLNFLQRIHSFVFSGKYI
uniref:Uncharacterized protein n=1 Tax=Schistocephalus solidus TaxID=70667 RepID=A0A0V0J8F5_SCHSO